MPIPQMLNIYRHEKANRVLITLAGEIDLESAPLVGESLGQCLREGIRTIDVDLTTVTFCDCSGLNAFLAASWHTAAAGGTLRLHHPSATLVRLFIMTGSDSLLLGLPAASRPSVRPDGPVGSVPATRPPGSGEIVPWLAHIAADASGRVL